MERMFADFDAWLVAMTVALMLSSVLSAMLVGREQGRGGPVRHRRHRMLHHSRSRQLRRLRYLNQPDRGLLSVSQEPIQLLLSSMSE